MAVPLTQTRKLGDKTGYERTSSCYLRLRYIRRSRKAEPIKHIHLETSFECSNNIREYLQRIIRGAAEQLAYGV